MKIWYNNMLDAQRYVAEVVEQEVRFGRGIDNDVVLESPFVADEAALLSWRDESCWTLTALGLNGCEVNEQRLSPGDTIAVRQDAKIVIFPYTVSLGSPAACELLHDPQADLDHRMSLLIRAVHIHLLSTMDLRQAEQLETVEQLLSLEKTIEEIARINGLGDAESADLLVHIAGHALRSCLVDGMLADCRSSLADALEAGSHWSRLMSAVPERESELETAVRRFRNALALDEPGDLSRRMKSLEDGFWPQWKQFRSELFTEFVEYLAFRELKKQIKDIVFGYGPLEDLLRMPTISEIMVVSRDKIYVEQNGVVENSGRQFISDQVTLTIIERIVSKVGRRIDKSQPLVDARLVDGSRVNAVIAPLAVSGPSLTIRKFPLSRFAIDDLLENGTLTRSAADFLRAAVRKRRNILIAGGTGSGKTTLLNCLSDFIPEKERIVTIEDTAELQLNREHAVRLETKQANVEGAGAYSIHDLVRNALRMRPDRILVGECRGPEALDMLQAMNTGHDGSLTTIHANSAADVVLRLEVMVQSAADLPIASIHRQITAAIDLVVQLSRMRDGSRKVTQITEYMEVPGEAGVASKDLFRLDGSDRHAVLAPTGRLPSFMDELIDDGLIELETFFA